MTAAAAIKQAEKAGIRLVLSGDNLRLKGSAKPPPALLARLREHKLSIVAILKQKAAVRPNPIQQEPLPEEPSKPSKPPAPDGMPEAAAEMERETFRRLPEVRAAAAAGLPPVSSAPSLNEQGDYCDLDAWARSPEAGGSFGFGISPSHR